MISQFAGFVPVPLFDSGLNTGQGSIWGFDNNSQDALISAGMQYANNNMSFPTKAFSTLLKVGGLSTINQGGGFEISRVNASYWDGYLHGVNGSPLDASTMRHSYIPQLDQPSINPGSPWGNVDYTFPNTPSGVGNIGGTLPGNYFGQPCTLSLVFNGQYPENPTPLYSFNGLPSVSADPTFGTGLHLGAISSWFAGTSTFSARMGIGNPWDCDNALFFGPGSDQNYPRLVKFNSLSMSIQYQDTVHLDDPNLDPYFQTLNNAGSWHGGFIVIMNTDGAGPTGQLSEVAVFTADMATYWLLAFEPQDELSYQQLTLNEEYDVKIDTQGIIWLHSQSAPSFSGHVSFSFSTGFNFPVLYLGSLQPITLPCFVSTLPGLVYPNSTGNPIL
jgi:hypothetical protein